jgi:lipopolysaccharide export system protein LptA
MKKIYILVIFLFIGFGAFPGVVSAKDANVSQKGAVEKDLPIEIVSNRLDAYNEKQLVIFSGDAVATQGDKTIKADKLLVYYKKSQGQPEKTSSKTLEKSGDLDKIEAKGRVTILQGDRIVSGDDAVFYNDAQKITMTGNAVMREGNNIVRGDTIVVYLNENRGVVEGTKDKRVKATIYPKKEEGKK